MEISFLRFKFLYKFKKYIIDKNFNIFLKINANDLKLSLKFLFYLKGLWYTIRAFRSWDALMEDLNQHLCDSIALPHGVRYMFTVEGLPRFNLDELEHGQSYVCSSTDKFKAIDYANASQPIWSFVSANLTIPPKRGIRVTFQRVSILK